MAGYRRRRSYGYSHGRGYSRAREHISEAERLTRKLGGLDQDIKQYFLNLPGSSLEPILREYGKENGSSAESYARQAIPRWRSGATKMSGMVATRLVNLLPPMMSLGEKYALVEKLWSHYGPSSRKYVLVGADAPIEQAVASIRSHIEDVVSEHHIPSDLGRQFAWLAGGDVGVKQGLLNHMQTMEREAVVRAAYAKLPIMLDHVRSDAQGVTKRLAEIVRVGKHEVHILVDRKAKGVTLHSYPPATSQGGGGGAAILWIGAILLLLFFIFRGR